MRKVCSFSLGAVLLAVGFTSVWARPPAAPVPATPVVEATAPAAVAPLDPYAQDLLYRLNSTNTAEREAAQKQLASIAGLMQSQDVLARLRESTTDPDLKDFFATRVSQIKARETERRITNLPHISLDVNGANMTQLAAAFNEALGTPNIFSGINSGNVAFTLSAKDKPFWEIFAALSQQRPLSIQNMGSSAAGPILRLTPSGNPIRRYVINGPALACITNVSYQRGVRLQNPGAGDDSWGLAPTNQAVLIFNLMVLIDPRVRLSRYMYPTPVSAQDDAGNNLALNGGGNSSYVNTSSNQFNHGFSLPAPDNLGKSLNLVCETRITVAGNELPGAIDDVENNIDKPVTVGSRTFRVTRFVVQGNISLQISVTDNSGTPGVPPGQGVGNSSLIPYTLIDGAGRIIWTSNAPGNGMFSANIGAVGATGPFRLQFRVPDKTLELPLRFEFKDVPLP